MREEDATETLQVIAAGELSRCVVPWVPLMRNAGEVDTIKEWKRLAESEPDVHLRSDFGGIALVFADLAKRGNLWRQELEGWNVQQTEQVLEWQNEATKAALLRVMRRRFDSPLPDAVEAAVKAVDDAEQLGRWLDAASTANDLAAWRSETGV